MVLALVLTAAVAFIVSEAVGFAIHRLAHWPKAGKIFRDHLFHHAKAYPPSRYLSESYIGDFKTSFVPFFVPAFLVLNGAAFFALSLPMFLTFLVISSAVSCLNVYLHDSFHIEGHPLRKFSWYRRLQEEHLVHHENVKRNFGIYFFFFDRVLGSYARMARRHQI